MRSWLWALMITPALAAADEARNFEFRMTPGHIGYSNYSGFVVGGRTAIAVDLSERWQWEFGMGFAATSKWKSEFSLFTGPRFNLSEDRSRSWFVGLGLGYGENICCDKKQFTGIFEVGKRFRMTEDGAWTFGPSATYATDGKDSALTIYPINFTYSF